MLISNAQAVLESIRTGSGKVLYVQTGRTNQRIDAIIRAAKARHIAIQTVSADELNAMVGERHRGVVLDTNAATGEAARRKGRGASSAGSEAVIGTSVPYEEWLKDFAESTAMLVFLDGITDPHNLGAILRSADIFQADAVVIPNRRSAAITSTVVEISSGASHYVRLFQVTNLNRAVQQAQKEGFWIYGADMNGTAASEIDLRGKVGLIMGSEGFGLHQQTTKLCDGIVSIPMRGNVDSLNVSVAAGVLMYEVRRQHGWK
ncbi:MAG: 23S rRNA (guanosine(2251)-2'-O)-methyltransferase RlmB [Spirochaeta sp.]